MRVYTFETPLGFVEEYDLRTIKKRALEVAKRLNREVLVTKVTKPSYKQDWFTMRPDGTFIVDAIDVNKGDFMTHTIVREKGTDACTDTIRRKHKITTGGAHPQRSFLINQSNGYKRFNYQRNDSSVEQVKERTRCSKMSAHLEWRNHHSNGTNI